MELIFYGCLLWFPAKDRVLQINCIWASLCTLLSKSVDTLPPADLLQSALMHSSAICPHQTTQLVSHQPTKENLFFFKLSKKVYGTFIIHFNHHKSFWCFWHKYIFHFLLVWKKMLQVTLKMIMKLIRKNSTHFSSRFDKRYTVFISSDKIKMTQNDYLITVLELDKSSSDFK